MLSSILAPPPSISCPRSMDLCRKPSSVLEMRSRSQKRALGTSYCTTRLNLGIRMVSVSFSCGLLGALTWAAVLFFCFCFSFVQGRGCCAHLAAAWVLEGVMGHGFLSIASVLTTGEASLLPGPVGGLSLKCPSTSCPAPGT